MDITPKTKDKQAVGVHKEQKSELKKTGTYKMYQGHTLFEVNMVTGEFKPAVFESADYIITKGGAMNIKKKKLIINTDCQYVAALNVKNLMKKLGIKANLIKDNKQ